MIRRAHEFNLICACSNERAGGKTMATTYSIHFADGRTETGIDTYENAVASLLDRYPGAEIGHDGDLSDDGDRTLCWADEESARNDDGAKAFASIRAEREEEGPQD